MKIFYCFFFLLLQSQYGYSQSDQIVVGIGASLSMPKANGIVHLADGSLAVVRQLNSQIVITGKKIGLTNLRLQNKVYQLHILGRLEYQNYIGLSKLLSKKMGLVLSIKSQCINIGGTLYSWKDYRDILQFFQSKKISGSYRCKKFFNFSAQIFQNQIKAYKHYVTERITSYDFQKINWDTNSLNTVFVIDKSKDRKNITQASLVTGLNLVNDPGFSSSSYTLQIDFIEHIKSKLNSNSLSPPTTNRWNLNTNSWANDSFLDLDFLKSKGKVQSLYTMELDINPNEELIFLSGGEIPITSSNKLSTSVIWKEYGLRIKAIYQPRANKTDILDLDFRSSNIDDSLSSIEGLPGLSIRSLKHRYELKTNQVMNLGKLFQISKSNSKSGNSLFMAIPIINEFLNSKKFRNNESDIYIRMQVLEGDKS
ncbi:MAG: hypothetical protein AB8E15_04760 [Bdellovibrionales bacterium]